jgi:hypothetical protein
VSGGGSRRYNIGATKEIINKAREAGATVIVMEDLEVYKEDLGSRSLMEEYIDGVIGVFSGYWSIRRNSADYM